MASQMIIRSYVGLGVALLGAATLMTMLSMSDVLQARNSMTNIIITGTLTDKGVECPAMISDDDQLYSLIGNIEGFKAGQHIKVEGKSVAISHCRRGTAVVVQKIELTDKTTHN